MLILTIIGPEVPLVLGITDLFNLCRTALFRAE
jgi:phosphoribosylamine-glycine ligase